MRMKKLFTLMTAFIMALGVNAQSEVDIDLSQNWGWGWSVTSEYADNIATVTLTGNWGAFATGWDGADWSKYNKLCVDIESYNNDWGQVYFTSTESEHPTIASQSFSTITSHTTVTVNFEPTLATSVYQLAIQGKSSGDIIKISRVYLVEALTYGEGKELAFDEYGSILASEFDGLSDQAKIVFTVEATGEATNGSGSVLNWGIGNIKSIDGSVNVGDLLLKKIGDNEYSYSLAELKAALEAPADQYGRQGLYWNVWNQGNATCSRKSIMAYEVEQQGFDIWTIAGASALMGSDWSTTDESNNMTTTDGITYTLVKEGVTLEKGFGYPYKVAKDNGWTESYGANGGSENANLYVDETGIYTVTFTFINDESHALTATAVKTGDAQVAEKTYSIIGTINGNWDTDTDMTKNDQGLYVAQFTNVAAGNYEFKIRVNHDWGLNYGLNGAQNGSNIPVTVEKDGSVVDITFNLDSKEITVSVSTPTAIKGISTQQSVVRYNMAGQQVDKTFKGVVIANGKKLIQK